MKLANYREYVFMLKIPYVFNILLLLSYDYIAIDVILFFILPLLIFFFFYEYFGAIISYNIQLGSVCYIF